MPGVGGSGVVVSAALSQLGKPYIWDTPLNAADPNPRSFDCSGLAMWCYHKAGVTLAHQTNVQYRQLKHRPLSEAQPGDLVFFGTLADLYHVGVFIGNSTIVEAPDYGIPVRKRVINGNSTGIYKTVGVFPGAQTTTGGAKPVTYREFFTATLRDMGLPVTDANLRALARVSIIEGTNDRWNPLNSVVQSGDSQSFNSVGVQDYGSYGNGVTGTVKLLRGSAWASVVDALRSGNSEGGVITAFANTYAGWGSHPAFGSVSDSRADTLLSTSMGNSVTANVVSPPYPKGTLHKPLTPGQRLKIYRYLASVWGKDGIAVSAALSSVKDSDLIAFYDFQTDHPGAVMIGGGVAANPVGDILMKIANATQSTTDALTPDWTKLLGSALSWLSDAGNWKRIGLFALGAIVLIISSVEFVKG